MQNLDQKRGCRHMEKQGLSEAVGFLLILAVVIVGVSLSLV